MGPIIEPCGKPHVISLSEDLCSLTWVLLFSVRKITRKPIITYASNTIVF